MCQSCFGIEINIMNEFGFFQRWGKYYGGDFLLGLLFLLQYIRIKLLVHSVLTI